ncbi:beta strand repeat-containing protein [Pasteurella testudinis]|uniref:beta strand repeat-containing protein n=1 Tax=Pasteurella testudinis TaxID=761 RepID=UPI004059EAC0
MPVNRTANNKNLSLKPFAENQATDMPRIWAMNGALKVAPSQENSTELKIQLMDSQGEAQTVIVTKNAENQWIRSGRIQNSKPNGLSLDPKSGEVTIEKKFLLFGSKLIVNDTNGKMAQVETNVLFQPVFSQETASFKYFENHLIKNPIATVAATDEDNKIKEYLFVHTNGAMSARSEDGKYAINTKGEIYLTVSGGGALISTNSKLSQVDSNDYETSTNQFGNYNIIAVDQTNLVSEALAVTFKVNDVSALPFLYHNMDGNNGINSGSVNGANSLSSNQTTSTNKNDPNYMFTSEEADKILIGYTESGNAATGLGWGNVERGAVLSTLAGDDYVQLSQSVGSNNMDGGIDLGSGDNTLLVGNDIIGGTNRSWVIAEDGNDTIIVGDFSNTVGDRDDIENATVLTGAGNDTLRLQGGDIKARSLIDMGAGNDSIVLSDLAKDSALQANQSLDTTVRNYGNNRNGSLLDGSVVVLGAGDDSTNITRNFSDSTIIGGIANGDTLKSGSTHKEMADNARNLVDNGQDNGIDTVYVGFDMRNNAKAYLGGGNDIMQIGTENSTGGSAGNVLSGSIIDMGAGDDVLTVGVHNSSVGNVDNSTINMGAGNDTVTIKGIVQSGTQINMGDGNNVLTTEGVNNASSITFGNGNDSLTIKSQLGVGSGNPTISMGAGDDTVTWGGTSISSTNQIDGGAGKDTLILTTTTNTHTNTNSPTNLGSSQFKGFEVIEMKNSGNSVDIRYSDLLSDTTNESPLYIKGVAGSKVDLGQNNYNSDSASSANLSDSSVRGGSWSKQSTTVVDGVSYDVYHYSAATDTTNDVYIQTGIIVI